MHCETLPSINDDVDMLWALIPGDDESCDDVDCDLTFADSEDEVEEYDDDSRYARSCLFLPAILVLKRFSTLFID